MKALYFDDADTILLEFRSADIAETRDLDENTPWTWMLKAMSARLRSSTRASEPMWRNGKFREWSTSAELLSRIPDGLA